MIVDIGGEGYYMGRFGFILVSGGLDDNDQVE